MKVAKKIFNVLIDIVIVLIMIISIITVTLSITSKSSGVSNIFGIAPMSVSSNSMADTINQGDLIFGKIDSNRTEPYEVGDIVSFYQEIEGQNQINTHRIIEVVNDGGVVYYRTQGDNKNTNPDPDPELKSQDMILAKYTGTKIPKKMWR